MRKTILFILVLFVNSYVSGQGYEVEKWQSDLKFLEKELPKKHVDFYNSLSKSEFKLEINNLYNQVPNLSDCQIALKLQQILAQVNDTHTNVRLNSFLRKYREKGEAGAVFVSYWFKDGLYIIESRERDAVIVGKKIKKIGNANLDVVIDSLKTLFVNENESVQKMEVQHLIGRQQILQHFNFMPESDSGFVNIEVIDENNQTIRHKILLKNDNRYSPFSSAYFLIEGNYNNSFKGWFTEYYDDKTGIYNVQYNKCYGKELAIRDHRLTNKIDEVPSFKNFGDKVIQTIKEDSINKLIFDFRFNGGGSSSQGAHLIKELSKLEKLKDQNKIFVLIGRKTFSSAILNVVDFQENTDAFLVGEPTAGKASHYGEVQVLKLPNTGLMIGYSTKYFFHGTNHSKTFYSKKGIDKVYDDRTTILPDQSIELSFSEFINHEDPVINWVKNQ